MKLFFWFVHWWMTPYGQEVFRLAKNDPSGWEQHQNLWKHDGTGAEVNFGYTYAVFPGMILANWADRIMLRGIFQHLQARNLRAAAYAIEQTKKAATLHRMQRRG